MIIPYSQFLIFLRDVSKLQNSYLPRFKYAYKWAKREMLSATLDKIRIKEREEGREEGRKEEVIGLLKIYLLARFTEAPEEIMEALRMRRWLKGMLIVLKIFKYSFWQCLLVQEKPKYCLPQFSLGKSAMVLIWKGPPIFCRNLAGKAPIFSLHRYSD